MNKGGTRYGAGRPRSTACAEQSKRLDIHALHKGQHLNEGSSFTWRWSRDGESTGSIGVRVGAGYLRLDYTLTGPNGNQKDASQTIPIALTFCHYGGTRPWFTCPACHARAGVLYLRWGRFACRSCQKVAYASQSEDFLDRTWRKQCKFETRLAPHWQRPKGMRKRTYENLLAGVLECVEQRENALAAYVARALPPVN